MTIEVVTRHLYTLTNSEVIADVSQALKTDNSDWLDDLVAFLNDPAGADATSDITTEVLDIRATTKPERAPRVAPKEGK